MWRGLRARISKDWKGGSSRKHNKKQTLLKWVPLRKDQKKSLLTKSRASLSSQLQTQFHCLHPSHISWFESWKKKGSKNFKRTFWHLFLCSKHSGNIIKISFWRRLISSIGSTDCVAQFAPIFIFLFKRQLRLFETISQKYSQLGHLPLRWENQRPARQRKGLWSHSSGSLSYPHILNDIDG